MINRVSRNCVYQKYEWMKCPNPNLKENLGVEKPMGGKTYCTIYVANSNYNKAKKT